MKKIADTGKNERPDIEAHVADLNRAHDQLMTLLLEWARKPPTIENRQELLGAAMTYNMMAAGLLLNCFQIATTGPANDG